MKRFSVGLAAVVVSAVMVGCDGLGLLGLGQPASLTGDWIFQRGDAVGSMTLVEDGGNLTGSYGVAFFQFPLNGKRAQNSVDMTVTASFMGATSSIKITGEVSGDGKKVTGSMKTDVTEQGEDGKFVTKPATSSESFTATKK